MTPPAAYQLAGNAYQAQAVETAGPMQLVVMLYDGAIAATVDWVRRDHASGGDVGVDHRATAS